MNTNTQSAFSGDYRALIEQVKDYAIYMLSTEGNILTWNQGAEQIKGYTAREIIGRHFSVFYSAQAIKRGHPEKELEIAAEEGNYEEEGWRIRKDGSKFWASVVITALHNEEGGLIGFTKITRDLTERKRTEMALRESEERYRLLVEEVKDYGIFMLDIKGNILTWNAGAQRIKGYTANDIIGKHFSIFYPKDVAEAKYPEQELEWAIERGRFEDEGWRVRKDGSLFWANVIITAVYSDSGKLIGFSKVTRDLSERREAEEALRQSEERYRLMVEEVKDYGIFMLDPKGNVATWNKGAERIKGYKADEIIGKHFSIFYPKKAVEIDYPAKELKIAAREGRFEDEGWRIRKDGSRFWANVVITAIFNKSGKLEGFAKVTRDITERKEAMDKLEKANRELQSFAYVVSHDLKTPLRGIGTLAEWIANDYADKLDEKGKEHIDMLISRVKRLYKLINSILDYTKLDRATFIEKIDDVETIVRDIADKHSLNDTVNLSLKNELPDVYYDRAALVHIFQHLISNAIKFNDKNKVEIEIDCEDRENEWVFSVKDNGKGIAAQYHDRIFSLFQTLEQKDKTESSGVGLAIVKKLIEGYRGKIWVESEEGKGSTFYFTIPKQLAPGAEEREPFQLNQ